MNDMDSKLMVVTRRILEAYANERFDSVTFVNLYIPLFPIYVEISHQQNSLDKELRDSFSDLHGDCDCYWQELFVEDKSTIHPAKVVTEDYLKMKALKLIQLIDTYFDRVYKQNP